MNKFFLNLGPQPLANEYLRKFKKNQKKYTLKIFFNTKNKLVSISKRIPSKKMFTNKYPYRSSMSLTMRKSFKDLSKEILNKFKPKLIIEIGSNDGALITNFNKKNVIGIEPCSNLARITKKKGFVTYDSYWNLRLAKKIKKKHSQADLIYSANTLTHISNLNDVFKSIDFLLSKDGILIIEDPSLLECIKKNSYDQFYNEHIYLFSALALQNVIKKFNFEIFDLINLNTHGGSLRYYIKRKNNKNISISSRVIKQIDNEKKMNLDKLSTYLKFAKNVVNSKSQLIKLLKHIKSKNKKIAGYGATAKATTVLNYCNINEQIIDFFTDTTPDKINKYMPGKKIKIINYSKKILTNIDFVFLGAWNFKKEILFKEKNFIKKGGKFITHVPFPKVF
jgi:SAM-dependent methyltransferase